jgi:Flp pilus assembly pilin Flp
MKALMTRLVKNEDGQDLIEYGLLVGLITAVVVATIILIAPIVSTYYTDLLAAIG